MPRQKTIRLTPKERLAQSREFWVPPDTAVEVRGRSIADGMVYVGSGMGALSVKEPVEPAAIDPAHKGARRSRREYVYSGWNYTYTPPSYARLTFEEQERYLDWLAAGRPATDVQDFLWIYFYGLERRLMFDGRQDATAKAEEPRLLAEVERLRDLHPTSGYSHFFNSANALLIAASIRSNSFNLDVADIPRVSRHNEWDYPHTYALALSYALGVCAADGRPLPAPWALAWLLRAHYGSRGHVAMDRFPDQLQALFLHAYRKEFGEGIILEKQRWWSEKLTYYPSSSSFSGGLKIGRELPAVTEPTRSAPQLRQMLEDVIVELELFHRAVPSDSDRIPAIALGFLPEDMQEVKDHPALAPVAEALEARLGEQVVTMLPVSELFELFPEAAPRPTPKQAAAIVRVLKRLGHGIEPNPTIDRPAFQRSEAIALYRIESLPDAAVANRPETSPLALAALLSCIASDGAGISVPAQEAIRSVIERRYQLAPGPQRQLDAYLAWRMQHPATLTEAKRGFVFPFIWNTLEVREDLMLVVAADGPPAPARIKELAKVYKLLGFDSNQLHSDLHRVSTSGPAKIIDGEPVVGFGIPRESHEVVLDARRLDRVRKQTADITGLLDSVFGEQGSTAAPTARNEGTTSVDSYVRFAEQLAAKAVWGMAEIAALAASLDLMASGAIESINHRAIEHGLDPPIECDDDACDVDQPTLKELLAHV